MMDDVQREANLRKIDAEIANLLAETGKLNAETGKINRERWWYPFVVVGGTFVAALASILAVMRLLPPA